MDWNTVVNMVRESGLEVLVYGEQGRSLETVDFGFYGIMIAIGLLWCFLGVKLIRFWSALIGLCIGLGVGTAAGELLGLDTMVSLGAGAVLGIILLVLCARFYRFGAFVTVLVVGSLSTMYLLNPQDLIFLGICGAVGLVLALLSIKFTEVITIIVTAVFGALTAEGAAAFLLPIQGSFVEIIIGAVLGAAGVLIQLLLESKKRKKQSLKKAAEIRDTHSTANEVERARAMMENLDKLPDEEEEQPEEEASDDEEEDDDITYIE